MIKIQFIERDGHPEFAVVPIEVWERIKHRAEEQDDSALPGHAKAGDDGFRIPAAILDAGLSKPYLSQIENRKRDGSVEAFQSLAQALHVPLDVLVEREGK
jgi:transcriptional regulator with XRE-family HTH domain